MGQPHKHAEVIKAWADGEEVQYSLDGLCPEQARMFLPQNTMTTWVWTGSLYAWVRVWKQRTYPTAQLETRNLVHQIEPIMKQHFPVSWEALTKG